ncbi:MAG: hypothetical protein PHF56_24995 [Desulfuromonadaceae bacterium]|nr:hypothetical protein [Desulfuromonadaceae bacterium]
MDSLKLDEVLRGRMKRTVTIEQLSEAVAAVLGLEPKTAVSNKSYAKGNLLHPLQLIIIALTTKFVGGYYGNCWP